MTTQRGFLDSSGRANAPRQALRDLLEATSRVDVWLSLAWHDVRRRFRRSVLGPLWITLATAIMVATLALVLGAILSQPVAFILPYVAVGLVFWGLLSTTILESTTVFVDSAASIRNLARARATTSGRLAALIVTYYPDAEALARLTNELVRCVDDVIVVDNGSGSGISWSAFLPSSAVLVGLPRNVGIAAAQNRGVAEARLRDASHVLFLDQDSSIDRALVERLLAEHRKAIAAGCRVAAIGPLPYDKRLSRPNQRSAAGAPIAVDHLISSGSLIATDVLDRVGPFREDLFIDYVDIEWCLRARREGLRCYRVPDAVMTHEFGTPVSVLGLRISMRTPERHYYFIRNAIWLWRQHWVPLAWKLRRGPALIARFVAYAIVARPLCAHWRMMALGITHGLTGRSGSLLS